MLYFFLFLLFSSCFVLLMILSFPNVMQISFLSFPRELLLLYISILSLVISFALLGLGSKVIHVDVQKNPFWLIVFFVMLQFIAFQCCYQKSHAQSFFKIRLISVLENEVYRYKVFYKQQSLLHILTQMTQFQARETFES